MKKFVLQITFEKCYQELLLNTQEYVNKFGDYMSPNNSCIQSLHCEYEGDTLYAKVPQTKGEEYKNELLVLTLESILQVPMFFDPNKGIEITNPEYFIGQELYQKYIAPERNVDPGIHFLFYVSLTDSDAINNIGKFLSHLPHNLSCFVDIVALPNEISKIYKEESFGEGTLKLMVNNLNKIIALKKEFAKSESDILHKQKISFRNIYFLQNVDEAGHAMQFDEEKLIKVFGNLVLSLIEGYDYISDKRIIDDITTFGIETFEIDKYKIINNWAFNIFKNLVDNVINRGDNEKKIDREKVNRLFAEILEEEKKALEKINSLPEQEVEGYLNKWKDELKEKILDKIINSDLNNEERLLLLSYFEDITNRDLLELEEFDISNFDLFDNLYIPYINQTLDKDNPYNKLKEIILQIQEIKKKIEDRQKSIADKKQLIDKNYRHDGKWTDGGYQIGDDIFKLHHSDWLDKNDAEPGELFSEYEPKPSGALPKNADLKCYFPPIKNQGEQGACASFSLTSVFEYFLNNEMNKKEDMSEAYVYYNAREIKGDTNIDEGANLYDVIKGMAEKGVCLEELCPYDPDVYDRKPSVEAYEDGKDHIVTKASTIPVSVETVKSAINDGYPVVGCFRVFESLQENTSGYIPMPTEFERKGEKESFHAMVICGYNDRHGHFIVRNSWGTGFGDNGYCYLPYSYLRDSDLTRYAVAITGIDAKEFIGHKPIEEEYDYNQKDNNIQYAILLNLLHEEEHRLNEDRKHLKELVVELRRVIEELKNRDDLVSIQDNADKQADKMSKEIIEIQKQKDEISFGSFKKVHIIHSVLFAISCGVTVYGVTQENKHIWIPSLIFAVVSILSWGLWYWRSKVSKHKELERRIAELEERKQSLTDTLDEKIRFRDKVIMILNSIGDIDDSAHFNRELLNAIIKTLNECYDQITDYLNNLPNQDIGEDKVLFPEWFEKIAPIIDDINLLKRLLLNNKDGDISKIIRKIQEDILEKLNGQFDKCIDDVYDNGNSEAWKRFLDRVSNHRVYAQIDEVKFTSDPERAKRKHCSYFLSDLGKVPDLPNRNDKIDIYSCSKNRYIFLQIKKVTLDELILFKNVLQ